jgi:hypothetical protein
VFQDGFGQRSFAVDQESNEPVEVLAFAPELASAPGFGEAVGERVAKLARVRHAMYARVRRIDRPAPDTLHLFSDRVNGWRLADVLTVMEREQLTFDVSAVLALLRQLIPAVALFSRHQRDAAIGTIGAERLILTPQGRLVVAEYVIAPGLERLQYPRERLWREFRVAVPPTASPTRMPPSADVVGIGVVALSLVLGRPLQEDEFLVSLGELVDAATETHAGTPQKLSAGFASWLGRVLQFDEHTALRSPQEAQIAFEQMLAQERGYITTSAQLDLFIEKYEKLLCATADASATEPPRTNESGVGSGSAVRAASDDRSDSKVQPASAPTPPPDTAWAEPARSLAEHLSKANATYSADTYTAGPAATPHRDGAYTAENITEPPRDTAYSTDPVLAPRKDWAGAARVANEMPEVAAAADPEPPAPPVVVAAIEVEPEVRETAEAPAPVFPDPLPAVAPKPVAAPVVETPVAPAPVRASGAPRWLTVAAGLLAATVIAEGGAIGWLLTREGSPLSQQGELVVQSRPAAARVEIDGEERGMTPLTTPLSAGSHVLEIRVGRSEPRVIPLQIRDGMQSGIYVELQSVATVGGLEVRSEPAKAKVTVAGQYRGTTPLLLKDLPPGNVDVLLESGARQVRQTVRIEPGITSQLVVPLER